MEASDERDDLNKNEVIKLAMEAFQWKEAKVISWYKLQNPHLGGNSPMELVQRKQTLKLIDFLKQKTLDRIQIKKPDDSGGFQY